jgi:hypothetical protein
LKRHAKATCEAIPSARAFALLVCGELSDCDPLEGMIAAQMLACHDTAMGCFRDALAANKPSRLFRDYLSR